MPLFIALLSAALPSAVVAQELVEQSTGGRLEYLLYGLIGFFGALAVLVFLWGFVMYVVRLGTVQRDDGIKIMEWAVGLALTVLALIAFFRFYVWISG